MTFRDHPLRKTLAGELHARPYGTIITPAQISHLALASGEDMAAAEIAHLATLCSHYHVVPPPHGAALFNADLGAIRLKWERHTEFSTYTLIAENNFDIPFKKTAVDAVSGDWLSALPGDVIAALHITVQEAAVLDTDSSKVREFFDNNALVGGLLADDQACWWTDFVVHSDGFSRFLIHAQKLRATTLGRITQRIIDIETYRMMAMLALPNAQAARPQVAQMETHLSAILQGLADLDTVQSERELLKELTDLSAQSERVSGAVTYRFSASRAYAEIVRQRVRALRENRVAGIQPAGDFLLTRFEPAMETCENLARRLNALGDRVTRASNLLRTRVDVTVEEQNRDLLHSMDRRAQTQLRLQATVEGLSVAAITYYVISLIIYLAEGAGELGLSVNPSVVGMMALPFVAVAIWYGIRRVRKTLTRGGDTGDDF
jgi:uncharacterized membrane-anchored protein